ncbi:collagen alpha-1(XXIII) chain [Clinocottus analis]|uniref:collagen alpha-1(XXIII) chain n=1 Tax=Clinocottus analis TaxID=304258 RepID=UPI0035C253EC
MDTANDSIGDSKTVCRCAPKSAVQRWLPGFLIGLCLLMSLSSIIVCMLMSFKTFLLEHRLPLENDKAFIFHPPHSACLNEDGTLIPELSRSIGKLVEEKVGTLMPKFRTTRDVGQECSCPPGPPGKRGRMGRRGEDDRKTLIKEPKRCRDKDITPVTQKAVMTD